MWVYLRGQQRVYVPTELDALSNKSARVLATSLHEVFLTVARYIRRGLESSASRWEEGKLPWLVHILVGDGVATNHSAARLLWTWLRGEKVKVTAGFGFEYFLVCVKCGSHQANLSIGCAVTGRAAVVGCQNSASVCSGRTFANRSAVVAKGSTSPHLRLCGTVVRLYKYLVNDYYSVFSPICLL